MPTTKEILIAARKLIESEDSWAKGYYAYDVFGEMCEPTADAAFKFCGVGACFRVANMEPGFGTEPFETALRDAVGEHFVEFNDDEGRTHAEVLAAFDKAIAAP